MLYRTAINARYRTFEIPKTADGVRIIQAPQPQLKLLQSRLADVLLDCTDEIEAKSPDRRLVAHGFQRGRSILTNAKAHRKRRYVLNLDLKDFFGTINFGRVRGFFIADRNFRLDPKVATIVAQIACHENALPQGAPTSPVISNLIGHILDARLIRLARDYDCTYTRYADDLTFSTNRRDFPRELARVSKAESRRWILGKQLKDAIKETGFVINPSKTRMQIRGSRQETTGLIVNEKVNIRSEYYRTVRSMCHSLFRTGKYYIDNVTGAEGPQDPVRTTELAPLEGRLAHIYYVKARRDRSEHDNRLAEFRIPEAPLELYRRFLFYKYFVAPDRPVLVTEGKTDILYLRIAMKALRADFQRLVNTDGDQTELSVRFLNSSTVNQKVLDLGAGTGGMVKIISAYDKNWLKHYRFKPLPHPVIFVIDNDDGAKNVLSAAKKASKQNIEPHSTAPFFHIHRNLYLVKTPLGTMGEPSAIEDCLPEKVRRQSIEGRRFDPKKMHGDKTSLGKQKFAELVVRPNVNTIDFSGFAPILDGVSRAIVHYETVSKAALGRARAKSA